MTAQKGREVLLKLNTSGSTYATIGGAQSITLTVANTSVDVTNADSAGVRELLEGAGVNSKSIKFQGIYVDDDYIDALQDAADNNTHINVQLVWPGPSNGGMWQGEFEITQLEFSGNYNESTKQTLTLESSGVIVRTKNGG